MKHLIRHLIFNIVLNMRKTKRKTRKLFKKSKKFEHGMITEFDETYNGEPFFRKVFWYPKNQK